MATSIFFALAGVILIALWVDRRKTKTQATSAASSGIRSAGRMVPHALTMLVMVAHASEITRVVQHISSAHIIAALSLFAVWAITNSGSEEI